MWNGKKKALTFSFDDGVTQDKRIVGILNKYGLKATFNLNSALLGNLGMLEYNGKPIEHNKVSPSDVKKIYEGHEIAVHTLSHPNLTELDKDTVVYQVEKDRLALSELCGYEVRGMAYPCGGVNNDDRVAEIIKNNTGVLFSRTITSVYNFDLQDNLYRFNPSVYYMEFGKMTEMAEKFIGMQPDKPQIFYIWGHSYELDYGEKTNWESFDKFCAFVSGRNDIFYGTNSEVLLKNE